MDKSKVYFIKEITEDNLVRIFKILDVKLEKPIAIKVHSGENGNKNYLKPEFLKEIINYVDGTVVECNTAYEGMRNTTEKHKELINRHGWDKLYSFDIMDSEGSITLSIKNGSVIHENHVGSHIKNYNSMLVISHFKGHPMGGYGGALKQLSIGCASSEGKSWIHSAGVTKDQYKLWDNLPKQELFLKAMAESASSITDYFKGNIAYINVMCNMSVDCDCCRDAEEPCMKDIGILASLDPVAIDKACIDLVKSSDDLGKEHLLERIRSRKGEMTIDYAYELNIGNKEYELVEI